MSNRSLFRRKEIYGSIIEIILMSFLPFIWWLISAKQKESFFYWIGLRKIEHKKSTLISTIVISFVFMTISILTLYLIKDIETATSEFKGLGITALFPALIYAIFHTSLPEELFLEDFY